MKILLIKPPNKPSLTGVNTFIRDEKLFGLFEPLELELLAGAVKDAKVKILDMRVDPTLEESLEEFRPDIVGVTCWTTGVYQAKKIMAMVKSFDQQITTVMGGHHATLCPSDFHEPYVDIIVMGPGEVTFNKIVQSLRKKKDLSGIHGIIFQKNNKFVDTDLNKNPMDFSTVPMPRRDLTARYREHYKIYGEPYALIEISRGCSFKCNFCSIWKSHHGGYYVREPESIVEELEAIEEEHLFFCDPNTTHNVKQVMKLLDLIEERGIKKKYLINSRVNSIIKHPDIIDRWARLGLEHVLIGFESFKEKDLDNYEKRSTLEMNSKALEVIKRNNIISLAHFIVPPDYDEKDFDHLIKYVLDNDILYPMFTMLTPLPGSDLYEEKRHIMTSRNYELFDYGHCLLPTKLPKKEFYKQYCNLFIQCYSPVRAVKRLPLYFADMLLNHWKWHNQAITGVKEPWSSNIRTLGLAKTVGNIAIGVKYLPDVEKGYEDELVDYPPTIEI